jgi:Tol biopolymer transport system component
MSSERWGKVESLYHAALALEGDERERLLEEQCAGDPTLLEEVQSLLLHGAAPTAFFDTPAAELGTYGSNEQQSLIGTRLGAYEITDLVGVGGMGRVYRAHDARLGRDVAIKVLDERFTARFEREVRAVAALNHPNICTLHDIGPNYLVMEFVEGRSLATQLMQRPLVPGLVLHYGIQIAEALSAAHDKGIVHRDLKPENVLVTATDHLKLVDFGLALIRDPRHTTDRAPASSASGVTQPGTVPGTLAYMSPEQVRGESTDSRTDLFSFGVLLYEAATGRRAFARTSPAETIAAILKEEPPAIEGDPELDAVVRRCLVKDAPGRAQTAHEVAVALRAVALKRSADIPGLVRHGGGAFVVAAAALAIAVVAAGSFRRDHAPSPKAAMSYTQLTHFTDSAMAPALSPDGRMVAFFRSNRWFLSPDQVWIKLLPNGDPVQLTNLPQEKYGIAFSPDGSRVSFTMSGVGGWRTMSVPTLGGEPTLFMQNAAGLGWIGPGQILFSEIKTGLHMGIVTSRENRTDRRELYFPAHERAMAHYSWLSPDRKSVLVVEMDHTTAFQPCRLVPFDGSSSGRQAGPTGNCTAAAWSPDGQWMYFTAVVDGSSHLWRQRFPRGEPQQLTNGPNEESGIAMFPDGRSLITSIGSSQSSLWMHDPLGERQLTSAGYVETASPSAPPRFSPDGRYLYYLLGRNSPAAQRELWRVELASGKTESVVSGFQLAEFDIPRVGDQIVFSTQTVDSPSEIWMVPLDGLTAPRRIGQTGDASPRFIQHDEIAFRMTVGRISHVAAMKTDGTERRKVAEYPISNVHDSSPDGRWIIALAPYSKVVGAAPSTIAIPVDGGPPREICPFLCPVVWSLDAARMFVMLSSPTLAGTGLAAVIALRPGQSVPELPEGGLRPGFTDGIPGLHTERHGEWRIPAREEGTYAAVRASTHYNLFQVTLPD